MGEGEEVHDPVVGAEARLSLAVEEAEERADEGAPAVEAAAVGHETFLVRGQHTARHRPTIRLGHVVVPVESKVALVAEDDFAGAEVETKAAVALPWVLGVVCLKAPCNDKGRSLRLPRRHLEHVDLAAAQKELVVRLEARR